MLKSLKPSLALPTIRKHKVEIYLVAIIVTAFYLRTFNINWDSNYHFHPDERAIIMFTVPLKLPSSFSAFINPNSSLNPHFFAYGNMPIYLLKIFGELAVPINPIYNQYDGLQFVGRLISASFDTGTVFLVFILGSWLFSKRVGLLGSLIYAASVFPIQLSHYFAVDTLLTFFMLTTVLAMISFTKKPTKMNSSALGIFFGLALATKVSAAVLLFPIGLSIIYQLLIVRNKKSDILRFFVLIILFIICTAFIFVVTQPYVVLDFGEFLYQTTLQTQMSKSAFVFPYTLQYVGKTPYLYELKNMFLWGMGPILSSVSFVGVIILVTQLVKQKKREIGIILVLFYSFSYFLLFGKFAVGWMRYMLPIYPILSLAAGYFLGETLFKKIPKRFFAIYLYKKFILFLLLVAVLLYPLSYLSIYMSPNTRVQASTWINTNIPPGSSLAVEHWDDALPVYGQENYVQLTLPLYDPDTPQKWQGINATLHNSSYIILASNRLYDPLQKLTNCKVLPKYRCYPQTAKYYKDLFSGKLGFRKVAQFTSYPTIPLTNIHIVDDAADESFTVNDHPKIMIFEKEKIYVKNP